MTRQESRPLVEADLEDVFALSQRCELFTELSWPAWRALIQWALLDNPYRGDRALGHVIRLGGKCVGSMLYIYVPFRLGNWSGPAPFPYSINTHPDNRGVLGLRLVQHYLADTAFDVVISAHVSRFAAAMLKRNGSIPCPGSDAYAFGNLSVRRRIDNAAGRRHAVLGALSRAGFGALLTPFLRLTGYREVRPVRPTLAVEDPFDLASADAAEVDAFCQAATGALNIVVLRDAAYLRWRYTAAPHRDQYRSLVVRDQAGTISGLAVLQRPRESPDLRICELLHHPSTPGACEQVVSAALNAARRWGGAIIETRVGRESMIETWRRAGLTVARKPYLQLWVSPKPYVRAPAAIQAMYSLGDHGLY